MKAKFVKQSNYDFFISTDTSKYKGEWIAIGNKRIVSHGRDAEIVYNNAKRKFPNTPISLAKVPEKHMMVLLSSS
jgi:hypothetical protein